MLFCKIALNSSGFTNQIISFILSIICAIRTNKKVVIIDNFLNDVSKDTYTPISHIINLRELNRFLSQTYNVVVIDKNYAVFNVLSANYGTDEHNIDVTEIIKNNYAKKSGVFIDKNHDFNLIFQKDPCVGYHKRLVLKYEIDTVHEGNQIFAVAPHYHRTIQIEETYNEYNREDIKIDIENSEYIFEFISLNDIYSVTNYAPVFESILSNITYASEFVHNANQSINKWENFDRNTERINAIHLRVEPDAIDFWSKQNKLEYAEFKHIIESKYIELIQKYMNKTDKIIILSGSHENGVLDFLTKNEYNLFIPDKYYEDREKNTIVDLIISKQCNNVFLGCIHNTLWNGSTFSYYISKIVDNSVKKVGINNDSIFSQECVFY